MRKHFPVIACLLLSAIFHSLQTWADEPALDARQRIEEVVAAAGGEGKLLQVFRFRERVLITSTPAPPVTADEQGNRTSVVQVGGEWWIGTAKRDKDKVRVLCWAWSLRILLDPKSKVEAIPALVVADQPAFGLRVTESIQQPIDLYFDAKSKRLVAIDESSTRHLFSDWKQTDAGQHFASHVVGFKFADRAAGKLSDQQWYQTDILELTPLKELPVELK